MTATRVVMRRASGLAFIAALAAVLLGPVVGPVPAERALAAATDLTLVSAATYTVLPEEGRVHVVVDFAARYRKPETKTRKFFVTLANLAVLPGTKNFKVTGWKGSKVRVTKRTSAYTMLRIDFGSRLYSGKSHAFRLSFDLPDPGRDANRQVRIGTSLVTFPVWAFASDGAKGSTVSVRFPPGFEVAVESGEFDTQGRAADGGTVLAAGPLASPLTYFAYVSGQRPAVYLDTPLTVMAGPQAIHLTMRAWEDDPGWPDRIGPLFEKALPLLRRETGLDWPYDEPVVVQEAVSRSDGGYAGLFDAGAGRIEVAYWAEPLVVVHEVAHGWFNGGLLADRWASEGFASLYGLRAAAELKIEGTPPALTEAASTAAIPLNAWANDPGADRAVDTYGYASSLALAQAIAERAGDEALRRVWVDAEDGVGAYQPVIPAGGTKAGATAETLEGPPDWRGLLDLLEAETTKGFEDLWRTWVVREDEAALLDARSAARLSYERTLALAGDWVLPRPIRDALRAWQFGTAEQLMADARTVLAQRTALEELATRGGLALPPTMRDLFEAGSMTEASTEAEAERNAMLAVREATEARAAEADILTTIGMIGEEPEVDLETARTALAAGDLDRTLEAADDAYRAWNGAWQEGRRRALLGVAALATIIVLGSAIGSRVRRSRLRPPVAAAILALALVTGAAVVPPAAAPAMPFLAGFGAPVALAAKDRIDISTVTRYVVDPGKAVVRATVDITAVNREPPVTSGGTIRRFYFDGVNLGIQTDAVRFRATQDGTAVKVTTVDRDGYQLVTAFFRKNIYFQESAKVRLTFDLPSGKPRSESDTRVGTAFTTFLAWAFGDVGTVRVDVPKGFEVDVSGSGMQRAADSGGTQVYTASTSDPLGWYAWINARNDAGLTRQQVTLAGGDRIIVRGWPEDPRWRDRVVTVLTDAVPDLVERIGLPWPVDGALSVIEVHTPLLEGYAGFYDSKTSEITISEDLDDATIVHEASHAWFNQGLFTDRWINEGLAEEYADRTLVALGGDPSEPGSAVRASSEAFPLNDWPPPAPISDEKSDAREQYGYDASWTVIRAILAEAGEDGFQRVFRAADVRTTAYVGDVAPEPTALPNDWRRFLDLAEELGGAEGATPLIVTWAATVDAQASLTARDAARKAYHVLLEDGDGWAAPVVVRLAMDGWTFDSAGEAMNQARIVLLRRDELAAAAAAEGLTPDDDLEAAYEGAGSAIALDAALALAEDTASSLHEVIAAADAAEAPRDWLTSLGLDGADPEGELTAARAAWQAGDLDAATAGADATVAALAAAPGNGRTKVLVVGGGAAGMVILLGVVVLARRRRHGPVPVPAEPGGPYATLRPNGPPGAVPDAPPQPHDDEGADRS